MRLWLFVLCLLTESVLLGQFNFADSGGSAANDEVLDVYRDPSGAIYSTGYYNQIVPIPNSPPLLFSGGDDAFIIKQTATGTYQWATHVSGSSSDRGLVVTSDQNGNVYAAGYFRNIATCQGQSLTSNASSQDIYILKLSSSGNLLWFKRYGGSGIELITDLKLSSNGEIYISGNFRGNTQLGNESFQSVEFFNSGQLGYDSFIARLNTSGDVIDAIHLSSVTDDQLTRLSLDTQNQPYITIMSVGDLTIDGQVYSIINAGYGALIKFSNTLSLIDYKYFNSSFIDLRALEVKDSIVVVGGNFANSVSSNIDGLATITQPYTNSIFAVTLNTALEPLGWFSEGSESDCSLNDLSIASNYNVWVVGNFDCTFNSLSTRLGSGLFNNFGLVDGFALLFESQSENIVSFAQHLGGDAEDNFTSAHCGTQFYPVIGGGFRSAFYFVDPVGACFGCNEFFMTIPDVVTTPSPVDYCENENYNKFGRLFSNGSSDFLVLSVLDTNRHVFDPFLRDYDSDTCGYEILIPGFTSDQDTIVSCEPVTLMSERIMMNSVFDYNSRLFRNGVVVPNSFNQSFHVVSISGLYVYEFFNDGQCRIYRDTIYVEILEEYPKPELFIENVIYVPNIFGSPVNCGNILLFEAGTEVPVQGEIINPNDSLTWTSTAFNGGPPTVIAVDTSAITISQSGLYNYSSVSGNCGNDNCVFALAYSMANGGGSGVGPIPILPGASVPLQLGIYLEDQYINDTISICATRNLNTYPLTFEFDVIDPDNPELEMLFPAFGRWKIEGPVSFPSMMYPTSYSPIYFSFLDHFYEINNVDSSGWVRVEFSLLAPPDTLTTLFTLVDSFYIDFRSPPEVIFSFESSTDDLCPGDTLVLGYSINGNYPFTVNLNNHLSHDEEANQATFMFPGSVTLISSFIDSYSGCSVYKTGFFNVVYKSAPILQLIPSTGRKCPEDSILLIAQPGLSTYWIGPEGDTLSIGDSLYAVVPGNYYYNQIDFDNCPLLSNYREVKNITAFITDSIITSNICANQPAMITLAPDTNLNYQWLPPLFGSDTIKYISQPGAYAVRVELCSNVDTLRFTVSEGLENANIEVASFPEVLCDGGTLLLTSNPLANQTIWEPGGIVSDTFLVSNPGVVSVTVSDSLGCVLEATRNILEYPLPPAVDSIFAEEACPGTPIELSAGSLFPLLWYTLPDSTIIGSGTQVEFEVTENNQLVGAYAYNPQTNCRTQAIQRNLTLLTLVDAGAIRPDKIFCPGDTIIVSPEPATGIASGLWTGPNGFSLEAESLFIADILVNQQGAYNYVPIAAPGYCSYSTDTVQLLLRTLEAPLINHPDTVCAGVDFWLEVQPISDYVYTWEGPPGSITQVGWPIVDALPDYSGQYRLTSRDSNCVREDVFSLFVSEIPPEVPQIVTNPYVCEGDTLFLFNADSLSTLNAVVNWSGSDAFEYNSPHAVFIPEFNAHQSNPITLQFGINDCLSQITSFQPTVAPLPIFSFNPDTLLLCESDQLLLSSPIQAAQYSWQPGGNGREIAVNLPGTYLLEVTDSLGCRFSSEVFVDDRNCDFDDTPNTFSPNGDGINDKLVFTVNGGLIYNAKIYDRWGVLLKLIAGPFAEWDGTDMNGETLPEATYFYTIEASMLNNQVKEMQGWISLFR